MKTTFKGYITQVQALTSWYITEGGVVQTSGYANNEAHARQQISDYARDRLQYFKDGELGLTIESTNLTASEIHNS